jgi:hypothetical protein
MSAGAWILAAFAAGMPDSLPSPRTVETWHSPGVLASVKTLDSSGREHGAWLEWWPGGAMKMDRTLFHGQVQRQLDFYVTGRPRLLRTFHHGDGKAPEGKPRFPTLQAWAPDGRTTGMVREGNGEVMVFLIDERKGGAVTGVAWETYRDSLRIGAVHLDTSRAFRRLDSLTRAAEEDAKRPAGP